MFPRTPMTVGRVPGTRTSPVSALGGEGWSGRVFCHLSHKALPLDNDEVLGPIQPAGSLAVAGRVTERAGGRPHQDARLVHLFGPRLVMNGCVVGGVDGDVENPVFDRGFGAASVSHDLLQ